MATVVEIMQKVGKIKESIRKTFESHLGALRPAAPARFLWMSMKDLACEVGRPRRRILMAFYGRYAAVSAFPDTGSSRRPLVVGTPLRTCAEQEKGWEELADSESPQTMEQTESMQDRLG